MSEITPKKERTMSEEALRESHLEKIRQRLIWLKSKRAEDFHEAFKILLERHYGAGAFDEYEVIEPRFDLRNISGIDDIPALLLDNRESADAFADQLDIETDKLLSSDFIDEDTFFEEKED